MEKKKFNITVVRTDIYEIEVDPEVINDKWIKNFESFMWAVDKDCPHEDLAIYIGQMRARFGAGQYMEGFGYIPVVGEYLNDEKKKDIADGFKLKVISEDDEIDISAIEI